MEIDPQTADPNPKTLHHRDMIEGIQAIPKQEKFVTHSRDGTVRIWDVDGKGILAMEMNDEGVMLAQVLFKDGKLDFYMIGDTEGTPPLKFTKG